MQISRSHGVGARAGGFFAVSLAILALALLLFPSAPSSSPEAPAAGQAAMRVSIDPETGALTFDAASAGKTANDELEAMLSRSTEGLREVMHPHGGVSVHLQGRFQSASVARIDADGQLRTRCSEHASELEAFLHGPRQIPVPAEPEVQ